MSYPASTEPPEALVLPDRLRLSERPARFVRRGGQAMSSSWLPSTRPRAFYVRPIR